MLPRMLGTPVADPAAARPARWRPGAVFYGWYIFLAGVATNVPLLGVTSFGFSVFGGPLHHVLGWALRRSQWPRHNRTCDARLLGISARTSAGGR